MHDGWLDLAIDLDGEMIGRIQTFPPAGRTLPPGTFDIGIGLRDVRRGQGGHVPGHAGRAEEPETPESAERLVATGSPAASTSSRRNTDRG
jgi:hypothetical protein